MQNNVPESEREDRDVSIQSQGFRISKVFEFEAAHRLESHRGKCRQMHGHSYKLEVELGAPGLNVGGESKGMVVDFGTLSGVVKENIIDQWDHKFLVTWETPTGLLAVLRADEKAIISIPASTAELMAEYVGKRLVQCGLKPYLRSVTIWETRTSRATWKCSTPQSRSDTQSRSSLGL